MLDTEVVRNWWRRALEIRSGRKLREYLTGYLMVLPASLLIFLFGLFPVGFALFVSTYKWRLKRGDFIGLSNYLNTAGDLTYVMLLALVLVAAAGAYIMFRQLAADAKADGRWIWAYALPGFLFSGFVFGILRWFVTALPPVLDIADKIIGKERSRALFMGLLGEALTEPQVLTAAWQALAMLALALVTSVIIVRSAKRAGAARDIARFWVSWSAAGLAALLAIVTARGVLAAGQVAAENGDAVSTPINVVMISAGVALLGLAWYLWGSGARSESDSAFAMKLVAAAMLLVGGWFLIARLPAVIASGEEDMWEGLKVTLYYSIGTVPFQLAFGMLLAILLFQKLRGSEFFRMLFFLPYVTPVVAAAAVYRQMFSTRLQGPANQVLKLLGLPGQQWLREPNGIFKLIGEGIGLDIPAWAAGPSLALVVIMLFTIWMYAGYDAVIYLAGLGNIDRELIEAAEIDGASNWQIFRNVIFPLLSPTTYFLSLIAVIGTFKAFTQIWVMTVSQGGGSTALGTTDTFSVIIFREFYGKLRYGYASAMAFVLFAVILVLTLLNNRIQGSRVFYG
ncbi:MAG: ABC transporter permease subunit [Anaerolineales bacterium]